MVATVGSGLNPSKTFKKPNWVSHNGSTWGRVLGVLFPAKSVHFKHFWVNFGSRFWEGHAFCYPQVYRPSFSFIYLFKKIYATFPPKVAKITISGFGGSTLRGSWKFGSIFPILLHWHPFLKQQELGGRAGPSKLLLINISCPFKI